MKDKIFLLLFIIVLSAITFWAYPIIQERYFSDESTDAENIYSEQDDCSTGDTCEINLEPLNSNTDELENKESDIDADPTENLPQGTEPSNAFLEITRNDCDSECIYFETEKEKNYCLQACGLSTSSVPTENGCEKLSGLEKDYCWKSEAIEKTDFSICKKIEDSKIKEVCQNRITEDIIDNQKIEN